METPWVYSSFPAGTTAGAAAAAGGRCEQLSQPEDGVEAGWKTGGFEACHITLPSFATVMP